MPAGDPSAIIGGPLKPVAEGPLRQGLDERAILEPQAERLLFAVTQVTGSTLACASRGDAAMFATLQGYYALAAEATNGAGGRFIKGIGDGVLLTFPPHRAAAAVQALRTFQERANALWRGFDERCRVQVKMGAGQLSCGPLGPPEAARFDVVGDALNALFKVPWSDFYVSPEAAALL
jgi:class 3 adenylate cyclase